MLLLIHPSMVRLLCCSRPPQGRTGAGIHPRCLEVEGLMRQWPVRRRGNTVIHTQFGGASERVSVMFTSVACRSNLENLENLEDLKNLKDLKDLEDLENLEEASQTHRAHRLCLN